MEANSVMGKHEFVITVSNILPEFKSLPDWQKEAAYSQFSRDIEETTWDNDHLDPAELGQVMFSSGQLDKYLRVAVKAGGIMGLMVRCSISILLICQDNILFWMLFLMLITIRLP